MKLTLFLLFFCSRLALANSAVYVVGENYLLFSKEGESPVIWSDIEPKSWAMDADRCRLWMNTKADSRLLQFDRGNKTSENSFSGRIVSDFKSGKFVTIEGANQMQVRNEKGEVVQEVSIADGKNVKKVVFLSNEESIALFQSEGSKARDNLWVARLNVQGTEVYRFSVENSRSLWGNSDVFVDEKNNRIWIGYATNTPEHTYSPFVKSFSLAGAKESSFGWPERGLFFDGCLTEYGELLMARDIPTMPYTVPVYSFLEKLTPNQKPVRALEFNMNLLIDSMACESKETYFAVHSILGGEARQVMVWSNEKKKEMEIIMKLPSRAQKIFVCK